MEQTNLNLDTSKIEGQDNIEEKAKTYTEEEVMKLIQSESDKRVSQALKTQERKFKAEQSEAEKLAQMNEEQKRDYQFQKEKEEFDKQKKEFAIIQNKLEGTKILNEKGLPSQFIDYIVADNAETMMDNINAFEKLFKAAVSDEVSKRIGTSSQPKSASVAQTSLTKEGFKKMTIAQRSELYKTNPSLYKELTN